MQKPTMLDCGHMSTPSEITPGYGQDSKGKTFCFDCCAEADKASMRRKGRITMYLTGTNGGMKVSNWPSSLVFQVKQYSKSRHNIGRERVDVWFHFDGFVWHGYQIGDNSQICHCKRTKTTV
jgi:hypothetical protein